MYTTEIYQQETSKYFKSDILDQVNKNKTKNG